MKKLVFDRASSWLLGLVLVAVGIGTASAENYFGGCRAFKRAGEVSQYSVSQVFQLNIQTNMSSDDVRALGDALKMEWIDITGADNAGDYVWPACWLGQTTPNTKVAALANHEKAWLEPFISLNCADTKRIVNGRCEYKIKQTFVAFPLDRLRLVAKKFPNLKVTVVD